MDYGQLGDQWGYISKLMIFSLMLADLKDSISIRLYLFACPTQNFRLLTRTTSRLKIRGRIELWWQRWIIKPDLYHFEYFVWCRRISLWIIIGQIWFICWKIDFIWIYFNWLDTFDSYIETDYTRKSMDNDSLAMFSCWWNGKSHDQY